MKIICKPVVMPLMTLACIISLAGCGRVAMSNGVPATPPPMVLAGPSGVTQRTAGGPELAVLPLATATPVVEAPPVVAPAAPTPIVVTALPQPTPAPQPAPVPQPEPTTVVVLPAVYADSGNIICNQAYQHVVVTGENLFRIALRYRSSIEAIARANAIENVHLIKIADTLRIMGCARIETPATPRASGYYVVQKGDNLFRIGLKYNVRVPDLMTVNGLNSNLIYPGQRIYLP